MFKNDFAHVMSLYYTWWGSLSTWQKIKLGLTQSFAYTDSLDYFLAEIYHE